MLQVVINGRWYKNNGFFNKFNSRVKKTYVYFYDYDDCIGFIINGMKQSELERFRLNIYNKYHKLIKFSEFREVDYNGEIIEGIDIKSPIIDIDYTEFCELLPNATMKKRFFDYDKIREKYTLQSEFINYVKLRCPSM